MKFPLAERPFAPLQLTPEQRDAYERLAMLVVRECIDEFDEFVDRQHRKLDPRRWKAVKSKENVTVFKQLDKTTVTSKTRGKWSLPKLLGVGSVVGDFDDVLYGVLTPDVASTRVNTTYVQDEIVDCDVLETIQRGSPDDPFRFVGIKWLAKVTPSGTLVSPRDLTVVEATGVYVDAKGDRYGYKVMHSVELPQCPDLQYLGIVRSKVSSCFLFKSKPDDRSVEVFMTVRVEPGGKLPAAVAMPSAINSLRGFAKATYTAEKKKLAWLLAQSLLTARAHARCRGIGSFSIPIKADDKGRSCCALCVRPFSTFRSRVGCELCHTIVCSRCTTTRKISTVEDGDVKKVAMPICKTCITAVSTMDAADFALCEYVPGGMKSRLRDLPTPSVQSTGHGKRLSAADRDRLNSLIYTDRSSGPLTASFVSSSDDGPSAVKECSAEPTRNLRPTASTPSMAPPMKRSIPTQHERMWMQMHQLRVQAEYTYQLTRHNSVVMVEGS